jgi:hypothetical protein
MSSAIAVGQRTERVSLSPLEDLTVGILAGMVLVWITFQVVDLQALFPPIGILYALGSIAVAGAIVFSRRHWSPALASGWSVMMMIPESLPAIEHLLHWDDIYTHFGHYLIIMTFFPLAFALVASGIGATVQNYKRESQDRHAPDWLRTAVLGLITLIVLANALTIGLYIFDIP